MHVCHQLAISLHLLDRTGDYRVKDAVDQPADKLRKVHLAQERPGDCGAFASRLRLELARLRPPPPPRRLGKSITGRSASPAPCPRGPRAAMRAFDHGDGVAGDLAPLRLRQGAEGGALGEHLAHFRRARSSACWPVEWRWFVVFIGLHPWFKPAPAVAGAGRFAELFADLEFDRAADRGSLSRKCAESPARSARRICRAGSPRRA